MVTRVPSFSSNVHKLTCHHMIVIKTAYLCKQVQGMTCCLVPFSLYLLAHPTWLPYLTSVVLQLSPFPLEFPAYVNALSFLRISKYLCWLMIKHSPWLSLNITCQNASLSAQAIDLMLPLPWVKSTSIYWNTAALKKLCDVSMFFYQYPHAH